MRFFMRTTSERLPQNDSVLFMFFVSSCLCGNKSVFSLCNSAANKEMRNETLREGEDEKVRNEILHENNL